MLLGSFYTYSLTENRPGSIEGLIALNKDHELYQGHFPNMPLVPGVCQVQIIKEIFEMSIGRKLLIKYAKDIKFMAMINPFEIETLYFEITYTLGDGNIFSIRAGLQANGTNLFKMRAEMA